MKGSERLMALPEKEGAAARVEEPSFSSGRTDPETGEKGEEAGRRLTP